MINDSCIDILQSKTGDIILCSLCSSEPTVIICFTLIIYKSMNMMEIEYIMARPVL